MLILAGTLVAEGALDPWWAAAVTLRDLIVVAGVALIIVRRRWQAARRIHPNRIGKVATAAQFVLLLVLVGAGSAPLWLVAATAGLSFAAALGYMREYRRALSRE